MRRPEDDSMDPEVGRALAVIDATLAGDAVEPEDADLAELTLILAGQRPVPSRQFSAGPGCAGRRALLGPGLERDRAGAGSPPALAAVAVGAGRDGRGGGGRRARRGDRARRGGWPRLSAAWPTARGEVLIELLRGSARPLPAAGGRLALQPGATHSLSSGQKSAASSSARRPAFAPSSAGARAPGPRSPPPRPTGARSSSPPSSACQPVPTRSTTWPRRCSMSSRRRRVRAELDRDRHRQRRRLRPVPAQRSERQSADDDGRALPAARCGGRLPDGLEPGRDRPARAAPAGAWPTPGRCAPRCYASSRRPPRRPRSTV